MVEITQSFLLLRSVGFLGFLRVKNRLLWRESLSPGKELDLQTEAVVLSGEEVIYGEEDLKKLPVVSRLAVALLQVAQGINYKFMKLPFVEEASELDEETGDTRSKIWTMTLRAVARKGAGKL